MKELIKNKKIIVCFGFVLTIICLGIVTYGTSEVDPVSATVSEIGSDYGTFADKVVTVTGEVIEWNTTEITITISSDALTVTRTRIIHFLLIKDLETSDTLYINVNTHYNETPMPDNFLSKGDIVAIDGIVRNVHDERLAFLGLDADTAVMRAFSITSPTGEILEIFSPPDETRESFPFKRGSPPNRARPAAWRNDN